MENKVAKVFLLCCVLFALYFLPLRAQEVLTQDQSIMKTASLISYKLQKYTGFNFFVHSLACGLIKTFVKLKTNAKKIEVNLEMFSGLDLIKKKARSFSMKANALSLKKIPLEYFELVTGSPIYFKKNVNKENKVLIPLDLFLKIQINFNDISNVFSNLPKIKKASRSKSFRKLELPLPPFGVTQVELENLQIKINERGFIEVTTSIKSLADLSAEPLNMKFSGNLILKDKRIIVDNLESEADGIFTNNSDLAKSFSDMLEDLINPVFNFHKYEGNGLTIDDIDLSFGSNNLLLKLNARLLP